MLSTLMVTVSVLRVGNAWCDSCLQSGYSDFMSTNLVVYLKREF